MLRGRHLQATSITLLLQVQGQAEGCVPGADSRDCWTYKSTITSVVVALASLRQKRHQATIELEEESTAGMELMIKKFDDPATTQLGHAL